MIGAPLVAVVVAVAVGLATAVAVLSIADRVQVEERLDKRDGQLEQAVDDIRRLTLANRVAIRRLERLERPTRLDLQRLFRGLLEAADPEEVRRLVRRLRETGIVLPKGGDRNGPPVDKQPPGQPPGP